MKKDDIFFLLPFLSKVQKFSTRFTHGCTVVQPLARAHLETVTATAEPSESSTTVWMSPLPKVRSPAILRYVVAANLLALFRS